MKGKKLIVLLVVLGLCCFATILSAVVAFLAVTINQQNSVITQLQANQTATDNSSVNGTTPAINSTDGDYTPTEADWAITSKLDTEETSSHSVDIIYPYLTNADHQATADDVNAYIKSLIQVYRKEVTDIDPSSASGKPFINLDFEEKFLSNNFVSIVISGSEYLGGAHPSAVYITINYDLKNNQEIKLADVFNSGSGYLTNLSATTREQLASTLAIDPTDSLLVSGTSATASNFKLFYFTGYDALTGFGVIFSEYQVAPYAAGTQTVELNVSDLSSMFNSEFSALF